MNFFHIAILPTLVGLSHSSGSLDVVLVEVSCRELTGPGLKEDALGFYSGLLDLLWDISFMSRVNYERVKLTS